MTLNEVLYHKQYIELNEDIKDEAYKVHEDKLKKGR